jgi:plastocyanin
MDKPTSQEKEILWRGVIKTPEAIVPFIGLFYSGSYILYTILQLIISGGLTKEFISSPDFSFLLTISVFSAIFYATAYLVWNRRRIGFIIAISISALFLVLEGSFAYDALSSPSIFDQFFGIATVIPALIAVLVYSVLGAQSFWRSRATPSSHKMIPRSSVLAVLIVGFTVGALLIGALSGSTEARLLRNSGTQANIVIVQGAGNQGNPSGYFSPSNFTTKVGSTVTWFNGDGSTHTITSKSSNLLDSGNIAAGDTFHFTFSHPGTYQYYCTIHPWMTGTIVVTS